MARYTRLRENEIKQIAHQYNLTVDRFEPMEGGAGNSSYLLHTRQGDFVLTVIDEKPLTHARKLGKLLGLLEKHRFPTTRLLVTIHGKLHTVCRAKPVILKPYIHGRIHKNLTPSMLRQVGKAMARLHALPAPDFLPGEHAYGRQMFPDVIGRDIHTGYESWLDGRLAHLERSLPAHLPTGLIHGDLFYDNILFEDGRFKAIIDFEEGCVYYKLFDLGMGIVGLCRQGGRILLDRASSLVEGYQGLRRLQRKEKEALQLFVEYAAVATSYWRFWKYHIDTPMLQKQDRYQSMVYVAEQAREIPASVFLTAVT